MSLNNSSRIDMSPDEYFMPEGTESPPRFDAESDDSLKVQRRGITSHPIQDAFWQSNTVFKNSVAAKLREAGMVGEAQTLESCHSRYTIGMCPNCSHVSKFPNRCDRFYCPECQPRLSQNRKRAVEWWTREIAQPKFVTLTITNIPDLERGHVQELKKMFSKLRRSKFCRNWKGGFYSIEVTHKKRGWHLHIHALVDARWIDSGGLKDAWAAATSGYGYIVKVKDARSNTYLAEVTKYVVKGSQLSLWNPARISLFVKAFDNVRTFGVFGTLYGARTKFREFWISVRKQKVICSCGCTQTRFFSEEEFHRFDLIPNSATSTRPPPMHTYQSLLEGMERRADLAALGR